MPFTIGANRTQLSYSTCGTGHSDPPPLWAQAARCCTTLRPVSTSATGPCCPARCWTSRCVSKRLAAPGVRPRRRRPQPMQVRQCDSASVLPCRPQPKQVRQSPRRGAAFHSRPPGLDLPSVLSVRQKTDMHPSCVALPALAPVSPLFLYVYRSAMCGLGDCRSLGSSLHPRSKRIPKPIRGWRQSYPPPLVMRGGLVAFLAVEIQSVMAFDAGSPPGPNGVYVMGPTQVMSVAAVCLLDYLLY
jgi:hypothetical protein